MDKWGPMENVPQSGNAPQARLSISFIHSFVHSFIRAFIRPFIRPFVHSFVHSSIRPFIRPFVHSSIRPFIRPLIRRFIRPSIDSSIHSFALITVKAAAAAALTRRYFSSERNERELRVVMDVLFPFPRVMFGDDLRKVVPIWADLVEFGEKNAVVKKIFGWVRDMYAFDFAAWARSLFTPPQLSALTASVLPFSTNEKHVFPSGEP